MTVIINKQEELKALMDENNNIIKDDLIINCNININAYIKAYNIRAKNIQAYNIDAWDIKAKDIKADDIKAHNINAANINAWDVKAGKIEADDIDVCNIRADAINVYCIKALSIKAQEIEVVSDIEVKKDISAFYIRASNIKASDISIDHVNAKNISYHTFCIARKSLICKTIEGRRQNAVHLCLDKPIEYIK